jgi:hypothetical protein
MYLKPKPLSRKQLTRIIRDYEERFEAITETLETLVIRQPDYSGALSLSISDEDGKTMFFYMVTKFCIQDPYITFYHLLPVDNSPVTINSFPDKPKDKSTRAFIKKLERNGRWNRVYEKLIIPSVDRAQFIGHFTYTKSMDLEDNEASFERPENTVIDFKTPSD